MSFLLKEYVIAVAKYTSVPSFFDNASAHWSHPAKLKAYILFPLKLQWSLVYFYYKFFILETSKGQFGKMWFKTFFSV